MAALAAPALALWLLLVPFSSQLETNADSERDLFRVAALVAHGTWPESGPAIDYLPLTLGPGWYLAVAPAAWLGDGSPLAAHATHVLALCVGLLLLFLALEGAGSVAAAMTGCLLLAASPYVAQVMVRVWHNALLPGVALIWWFLVWRGVTAPKPAERARALAGAWLATALMLQLHVVSVAYAAVLAAVQLMAWRADRLAGGRAWAAVSGLVCAGLLTGYLWALIDLDPGQIERLRASRTGGFALGTALWHLPEHLGSAWAGPYASGVVRWATFGALLFGAWTAARGLREPWGLGQLALVQLGVGLLVVGLLAGLSAAPRYYNGVMPAVFILITIGLAHGLERAPAKAGWGVATVALALCVWGGWLGWPRGGDDDRTHATPTLLEQRAILTELDSRWGFTLRTLDARAHGPIRGGLSAMRYLAHVQGLTGAWRAPRLADGEDVQIGPRGFPSPSTALETVELPSADRTLVLVRHRRRVPLGTARKRVGGRPCPIALPYHWSHLTAAELAPFGIRPGFDLERCRAGVPRSTPLVIDVPRLLGDGALYVLLQWYDVAGKRASKATLEASAAGASLPVERLEGEMFDGLALFRVPSPPATGLTLTVGPLDTLAVVDVY